MQKCLLDYFLLLFFIPSFYKCFFILYHFIQHFWRYLYFQSFPFYCNRKKLLFSLTKDSFPHPSLTHQTFYSFPSHPENSHLSPRNFAPTFSCTLGSFSLFYSPSTNLSPFGMKAPKFGMTISSMKFFDEMNSNPEISKMTDPQ